MAIFILQALLKQPTNSAAQVASPALPGAVQTAASDLDVQTKMHGFDKALGNTEGYLNRPLSLSHHRLWGLLIFTEW